MQLVAKSEKELQDIAHEIIQYAGDVKVWLLEGQLGAGKTTLVKNIGFNLQVLDNMSSPTYSIVNEYETMAGNLVYHIDCYRLKNEAEALDIGIEEYLYADSYCFIEWPDKIMNLLPDNYLTIAIEVGVDESRTFNLKKV